MANLALPRFLRMDAWSAPLSTTRHPSSSGFGPSLPGPSAGPTGSANPDTDIRPRWHPFPCQWVVTRGTRPVHTIHSQVISIQANEWCIPRCSNWLMWTKARSGDHNSESPRPIHMDVNAFVDRTFSSMELWVMWRIQVGLLHQWMAWSLQNCQLLAPLLPYWRSSIHLIRLSRMSSRRTSLNTQRVMASRWRCGWYLQHGHPPGNCRPSAQRCPCRSASWHTSYTMCWFRILGSMPQSSSCFRLRHTIRRSPWRICLNLAAIWPSLPMSWPDVQIQRTSRRTSLRMRTARPLRDHIGFNSVCSNHLYVCLGHFGQLIRTQLTEIFTCIRHASSIKAPWQQGVCVNHVKKCKTSYLCLTFSFCRGVRPVIPTWCNEAMVWWGKGELIIHLYLQTLAWMSWT